MIALYMPYHEMDIRQFVDQVNAMYKAAKPETSCQELSNKVIVRTSKIFIDDLELTW